MRYSGLDRRPRRQFAARQQQLSTQSVVKEESSRKHRPDYALIVCMSALLVIGAVTVYAISPGITAAQGLSENHYSFRQLFAILLGIVAFIVAAQTPLSWWKRAATALVVFSLLVSFSVRLFGDPINGAYRWLDIGGISFQAAELLKFTIVVWFGGYLAHKRSKDEIMQPEVFKVAIGAIGVVVVLVAGLQSDLGSAAVMMAIIIAMAFTAGMPLRKIGIVVAVIGLLVFAAITTSEYRRDRVATFLNPTADCQNEGYQACQALITVGSGGMFGKGLGRSVQAYGYLPEASNDSIFAIVSEKFGFIGSSLVVIIFAVLFSRMKQIAQRAANDYSRLLVTGCMTWLGVQMIINVGAMLGLLPLKGITLPLVSYGGTSIIFVMAAIGIVFHISRYTDLSTATTKRAYGDNNRTGATRSVVRRV